jgi:ABC-type thiamine transport system substrate-binding protein
MGCQIITGKDESGMEVACFYDSVTDTCFGVKLNDLEEAESFQKDCKVDLRTLKHEEFVELLNKFREKRENEKLKV